jgi:hypothetical protein
LTFGASQSSRAMDVERNVLVDGICTLVEARALRASR